MLVIVVDYKRAFVGSRYVESFKPEISLALLSYLRREFPGFTFDEILIIKDDKIVAEEIRGE